MKRNKILIMLVLLLALSSCKPYWYRRHVCRVNQLDIQYEHSVAAVHDPNRMYRNWNKRPINDTFLFFFHFK